MSAEFLWGAKAIRRHLRLAGIQISPSTYHRWRRLPDDPLPVRHIGGPQSTVAISVTELDEWIVRRLGGVPNSP